MDLESEKVSKLYSVTQKRGGSQEMKKIASPILLAEKAGLAVAIIILSINIFLVTSFFLLLLLILWIIQIGSLSFTQARWNWIIIRNIRHIIFIMFSNLKNMLCRKDILFLKLII